MTLHRNSDYRSAESIWRVTVNQMPHSARAHNNLGMALARCGKWDQATEQYRLALDMVLPHENPSLIFNNYGTALIACGRVEEAIAQYERALDLKPKYALAHYNYGNALASQSKYDEAATHYKKALEIQPDYPEAYNNLGNVLLDSRHADEAIAAYENALTIKPAYAEAHCNLAAALTDAGRLDEAIEHCQKALQLRPQYPKAGGNLQTATLRRQQIQQALTQQRELLRQHPNDAKILNETAWILATNPNASIRNGTEAVSLARQAVQRTESRDPAFLKTLAAAYAESGQFSEAVETARQALELATQQNLATEAEQLQNQLSLYEKGLPYRKAIREH
jgi:Flp pilus assembly protein TadD